ncbi:MAG TPA: hypothetical protein VFE25_07505 [Opitutaceae bacterium]|jgi:hypothetical protein|nr:hypothetical protein [Opitutaceae bacterium]
MNKQTKQVLALVFLMIAWGISWRVNRIPTVTVVAAMKAKAAKATQAENLLSMRFHRLRAQMDGLYHYRIKPVAFDSKGNPFRLPASMMEESLETDTSASKATKGPVVETAAPMPEAPAESGDVLLKHAIETIHMGGVVTMHDTTEITVNGELRKEGDVFTVMVKGKLVLLKIKHLTTSYVVLALDDPAAGNAEARVRLN